MQIKTARERLQSTPRHTGARGGGGSVDLALASVLNYFAVVLIFFLLQTDAHPAGTR